MCAFSVTWHVPNTKQKQTELKMYAYYKHFVEFKNNDNKFLGTYVSFFRFRFLILIFFFYLNHSPKFIGGDSKSQGSIRVVISPENVAVNSYG